MINLTFFLYKYIIPMSQLFKTVFSIKVQIWMRLFEIQGLYLFYKVE